MAGDRQDLPPLIKRDPRGDQAARLRRGFHHDDCARKARDDPVSLREVACHRLQPRGLFRKPDAACGDVPREGGVFGRIDVIDAARHHRDRAGGQRGRMGDRVDPARQARGDDEPPGPQPLGQTPRHAGPKRRGTAGTDDGHRGAGQDRGVADRPEDRRRIRDFGQGRRIVRVAQTKKSCAAGLPCAHL